MSAPGSESRLREEIASFGALLTGLGMAHGSTGNISVRQDDGSWLLTPTNSRLGRLDPARIARLDADGRHLDGDPPSKEAFLHRCVYEMRGDARAIVHLHSTHSVAVSCLAGIDADDVLPPLTAYYVMRVGKLPLIPYFPPGDERLAAAVRQVAARQPAVLLANHGPVVAGSSLDAAVGAIEELEATARLFLLLQGKGARPLGAAEVAELEARYPRS
jgi:3-dehydro-4-phosphotetronate decarboxylase